MIHFDFIVSDIDAENIIECVNNRIVDMEEYKRAILTLKYKNPEIYLNWADKSIEYYKELKLKMKNTKIEEKENV